MKTMGRIRAGINRARRFLGMKQQKVRDTNYIRFRKPKLVGAVITYGKHKLRLIQKVDGGGFLYESAQHHHAPKYR
jgi:hypothetical protein